ncbi:MAG: hypothetical protein AAF846_24890 [Chloroflexota bacterium]
MMTQFPTITGKTVNGARRTVPQDLYGKYNVVLIAFEQHHQYDIDTWIPALKPIKEKYPDLDVFELPIIEQTQTSMVGRMMVDFWMYTGIPDSDVRDHTITCYIDLQQFLSTLNMPHADQIYALLIDQTSIVYWQTSGVYTPTKLDSLTAILQDLIIA